MSRKQKRISFLRGARFRTHATRKRNARRLDSNAGLYENSPSCAVNLIDYIVPSATTNQPNGIIMRYIMYIFLRIECLFE